jgi:hypothetical protein
MRPGWDPRRRNRNIGTAKAGRGHDNKLTIPCRGPNYTVFWAALTAYKAVRRDLAGSPLTVLVERVRPGSVHCCTVDDVAEMLGHIPAADRGDIELVILRQPKRKEEVLASCWGRLGYWVEVDDHIGPAIILEAVDLSRRTRWPRSLRPDQSAELDRLRGDGHVIHTTTRCYVIQPTLDSARATQLYRTLPHEVGHWVDYQRSVERPAARTPAVPWVDLWERYHARPAMAKEAFAHRYADALRARLFAAGVLPFERRLDERSLKRDGLRVEDFTGPARG